MNPKKKSKLEETAVDIELDVTEMEETVETKPEETVETKPEETKQQEKEEDTIPPIVWVKTEYVHVYEQVTNGGKRVGVLRQGAKVKILSQTFNWIEIQSEDRPEIKGFVRPGSLDRG